MTDILKTGDAGGAAAAAAAAAAAEAARRAAAEAAARAAEAARKAAEAATAAARAKAGVDGSSSFASKAGAAAGAATASPATTTKGNSQSGFTGKLEVKFAQDGQARSAEMTAIQGKLYFRGEEVGTVGAERRLGRGGQTDGTREVKVFGQLSTGKATAVSASADVVGPTASPGASVGTPAAASAPTEPQGFHLARPPQMPLVKQEREALTAQGYDVADAELLGIRPQLLDQWQAISPFDKSVVKGGVGVAVNEEWPPPQIFARDENNRYYSKDPAYHVSYSDAGSLGDGGSGSEPIFQKSIGKKLMLSEGDAARMKEMASIPKDLTWDSLLQKYGQDFRSLAPAIQEKVKANPRLAIAGLKGLTVPWDTSSGASIWEGGLKARLAPSAKQPDGLNSQLQVLRQNSANHSYLSVGCEGGFVGMPGQYTLGYMGWDDQYGLVGPKSAYLDIHDDDNTFSMVAGAVVGLATGGAGWAAWASGMASGATQALVSGGDVFKGALLGGVTGGLQQLTPGLSSAFGGGWVGDAAAGAITGGAASVVRGGDFVTGALGGAAGSLTKGLETKLTTALTDASIPPTLADAAARAVGSGLRAAARGDNAWQAALGGAAEALTDKLVKTVSETVGTSVPLTTITRAVQAAVVASVSGRDPTGAAFESALDSLKTTILDSIRAMPSTPAPKLEPGQAAVWNGTTREWVVGNALEGQPAPLAADEDPQLQALTISNLTGASITPGSTAQGVEGNCWVLATIDDIARKNPGFLDQNMMFNEDGSSVTVKLFDASGKPTFVTVDTTLYGKADGPDSYKMLYGSPTNDSLEAGLKAALLQKALAYALPSLRDPNACGRPGNYSDVTTPGDPAEAMSFLTGNPAGGPPTQERIAANESPDTIFELMSQMTIRGDAIVAGSREGNEAAFAALGLKPAHAYGVIGVYRDENGTAMARLRNPYNKGEPGSLGQETGLARDGHDDGIFSLPLSDFVRQFDNVTSVSFQSPNPTPAPAPTTGGITRPPVIVRG